MNEFELNDMIYKGARPKLPIQTLIEIDNAIRKQRNNIRYLLKGYDYNEEDIYVDKN